MRSCKTVCHFLTVVKTPFKNKLQNVYNDKWGSDSSESHKRGAGFCQYFFFIHQFTYRRKYCTLTDCVWHIHTGNTLRQKNWQNGCVDTLAKDAIKGMKFENFRSLLLSYLTSRDFSHFILYLLCVSLLLLAVATLRQIMALNTTNLTSSSFFCYH